MLCTGAEASSLVSCSACQGLNRMRVERDDGYLCEMLHFIELFYACVLAGTPPEPGLFWQPKHAERYEAFLLRTRALSDAAQVDMHVARPWRHQANDQFFLS